MDNVTIYTFLFPIDSLHPARGAEVAPDLVRARPREGLGRLVRQQASCPTTRANARTRSRRTQALGTSCKINATPTLVFADGSCVPGALPLAQLEVDDEVKAEAEVKKLADADKK